MACKETGYALVVVSLHKDKSALLQRVPARCFVVAVLVNSTKQIKKMFNEMLVPMQCDVFVDDDALINLVL